MKVRSGGRSKTEATGQAEEAKPFLRRMMARITLKPPKADILQTGQKRRQVVIVKPRLSRMSHNRNPSRIDNRLNAALHIETAAGDISRTLSPQEPSESGRQIGNVPPPDESTRDMRPCDDFTRSLPFDLLRHKRVTEIRQPKTYRLVALPSAVTKAGQVLFQGEAMNVDAISEDVQGVRGLGRKLDARQGRDGTFSAGLQKSRQPRRRIVIRQGDKVKAGGRRLDGKLLRRYRSVGSGAVKVKVDASQDATPGWKSSCLLRPR